MTTSASQAWARRIGLGDLSDEAWIAHFARFTPLPGSFEHPLALRYHGHQFRSYNPDLGDGRGFLFAQLHDLRDGRPVPSSRIDGTNLAGHRPHGHNINVVEVKFIAGPEVFRPDIAPPHNGHTVVGDKRLIVQSPPEPVGSKGHPEGPGHKGSAMGSEGIEQPHLEIGWVAIAASSQSVSGVWCQSSSRRRTLTPRSAAARRRS